jgi:hypothetical protein
VLGLWVGEAVMNWVVRVRFRAWWSGDVLSDGAPWWELLDVQRHMIRSERLWDE